MMRNPIQAIATRAATEHEGLQQAYWFGAGPKEGMTLSDDMRVEAVSCTDEDEVDLQVFGSITGTPPIMRSSYDRLTIVRACTTGLVEMAFQLPGGADPPPVRTWLQIALFEDDGGVPGDLLGRCVPLPLTNLHTDNMLTFILPLWEPVELEADTDLWVGIMPKAYSPPDEDAASTTSEYTTVLARGSRTEDADHPLIKAWSPDVEPPLTDWDTYTDRHHWIRLYSDPETRTAQVISGAVVPMIAAGVRSVAGKPQRGRPEGSVLVSTRPGHYINPWYLGGAGAYISGSGAGSKPPPAVTAQVDLAADTAIYDFGFTIPDGVRLAFRGNVPLIEGTAGFSVSGTEVTLVPAQVPHEVETDEKLTLICLPRGT